MNSPQLAVLLASMTQELKERRLRFAKQARNAGRELSVEDEKVWAGAEIGRMLADHQQEATLHPDGIRLSDEAMAGLRSKVLEQTFNAEQILKAFESEPTALNMTFTGAGKTYFEMADGTVKVGSPVASSNDDVNLNLEALVGAMGIKEVRWDPNQPELELVLPCGSRLTAQRWITPEGTFVTIRRHTLSTVTFSELLTLGSVTPRMVSFLSASVKAKQRILVSGNMNAGKTVLLRALAAEIPDLKQVITVESQMELLLHKHPEVYGERVTPTEARRANSEGVGELTMGHNIGSTQRMSPHYVIVGEVRGPEVDAFMKAIQQGYPVMATIHANSAVDAIHNMAQYYEQYGGATYSSAVRRFATNVDLSVYVRQLDNGLRVVDQISRIGGADGEQVFAEPVWLSHEDRPGVHNTAGGLDMDFYKKLLAAGYDETLPDTFDQSYEP